MDLQGKFGSLIDHPEPQGYRDQLGIVVLSLNLPSLALYLPVMGPGSSGMGLKPESEGGGLVHSVRSDGWVCSSLQRALVCEGIRAWLGLFGLDSESLGLVWYLAGMVCTSTRLVWGMGEWVLGCHHGPCLESWRLGMYKQSRGHIYWPEREVGKGCPGLGPLGHEAL